MKAVKTFIYTLAILLAACTDRVDYGTLLMQADSLLTVRPDSALIVLDGIPSKKLKTDADRAYHALLLTQARDKNYVKQKDDSLILSAIAYYDKTSNMEMRARSYYYGGCVYRDLRNDTKAMSHFLTAKKLVENGKNLCLLSLICNNIGYLFYTNDLNEQADSVYQEVQQIAVQMEDSLLQAETLLQRGMIQVEKGKRFYPKAEKLMLQAYRMAKLLNNHLLSKRTMYSLSSLYSRMEKGKEAVEFAKQNLALQDDTIHCYSTYQLLGNAYYENHQYDSATFYLYKALPAKSYAIKAGVYGYLSDIAKASENYQESLELAKMHTIYLDSLRNTRSQQAYGMIGAEKEVQMLHQQKEHEASVNTYNYLLFLLVIVALLLFLFIRNRNRHKTLRLQEEKGRLEDMQAMMQRQNSRLEKEQRQKVERIAYLEKELEALHHDVALKEKLRKELDTLNQERQSLLKTTQEYSKIELKMKRIIQDYKERDKSELCMEKEDWMQLVAEADRRWNDVTLKLYSRYNLSQEEIHLCCLYLTDFPISHFGYLLNCQRDTIYKKANRIVEKKMGFAHGATSLQKVLKELCQERK
ncbi:hypothetical protein [Bacteroides sp.]|uniref:hypothetical protein n=1 Tax=Bacteroides sp. TaxID=29523 RepID=UPI0023C98023|nr:hypothetical protein [Bacteroides sp.]MDE6215723.1 hypothetical protein [Bacteroides sp.]